MQHLRQEGLRDTDPASDFALRARPANEIVKHGAPPLLTPSNLAQSYQACQGPQGHRGLMPKAPQTAKTSPRLRAELQECRSKAGLTQRDLAALLGVSPPFVSQIESGKRDTVAPVLESWAEACGARVAILPATSPTLDLRGLSDHQAQLVTLLCDLVPRLDGLLLATLEQQLRLWSAMKPHGR